MHIYSICRVFLNPPHPRPLPQGRGNTSSYKHFLAQIKQIRKVCQLMTVRFLKDQLRKENLEYQAYGIGEKLKPECTSLLVRSSSNNQLRHKNIWSS